MPQDFRHQKSIRVQELASCSIVLVDAKPVLRCVSRQDALRYAALIRRAMGRADASAAKGKFSTR